MDSNLKQVLQAFIWFCEGKRQREYDAMVATHLEVGYTLDEIGISKSNSFDLNDLQEFLENHDTLGISG